MSFRQGVLILSVIASANVATAQSQTTVTQTIVKPIPVSKRLETVKAHHTTIGDAKVGDTSLQTYKDLLNEADRVRAFQARNDVNSNVPHGFVQSAGAVDAKAEGTELNRFHEIEMFEDSVPAPRSVTRVVARPSFEQQVFKARHTVAKGDTLFSLSRQYGVSLESLRAVNGVSGAYITIGQTLSIPLQISEATIQSVAVSPVTMPLTVPLEPTFVRNEEPVPHAITTLGVYAVLPKDTLYGISQRSCVAMETIMATNGLIDPLAIWPGQRLTMPSGHCL